MNRIVHLHHESYSSDTTQAKVPIVIIPGLFGSTANWRGVARRLADEYTVILLDQRNHGRSPHAETNSYSDMVADLLALLDQLELPSVILCGHSMGGKVAMLFSLLHPQRVDRLAVLDIAPVSYEHSHAPFLDELLKIDISQLSSRSEADRALRASIPDTGTRLFLLQSLTGSAGNYRWRLNLSVLKQSMEHIVSFPMSMIGQSICSIKVIFLRGERSEYIHSTSHNTISALFPNASIAEIADAGHWLHVDQPDAVLQILRRFVKSE